MTRKLTATKTRPSRKELESIVRMEGRKPTVIAEPTDPMVSFELVEFAPTQPVLSADLWEAETSTSAIATEDEIKEPEAEQVEFPTGRMSWSADLYNELPQIIAASLEDAPIATIKSNVYFIADLLDMTHYEVFKLYFQLSGLSGNAKGEAAKEAATNDRKAIYRWCVNYFGKAPYLGKAA